MAKLIGSQTYKYIINHLLLILAAVWMFLGSAVLTTLLILLALYFLVDLKNNGLKDVFKQFRTDTVDWDGVVVYSSKCWLIFFAALGGLFCVSLLWTESLNINTGLLDVTNFLKAWLYFYWVNKLSKNDLQIVFKYFIIAMLIVGFYSLFLVFWRSISIETGVYFETAPFMNRIHFSIIYSFIAGFSLHNFVNKRKFFIQKFSNPKFYLLLYCFSTCVIFFNIARTGMFAWLLVTIFCLITYFINKFKSKNYIQGVLFIILFTSLTGIFLMQNKVFMYRLSSTVLEVNQISKYNHRHSWSTRANLVICCVDIFLSKPSIFFLGVGIGDSNAVLKRCMENKKNEYLQNKIEIKTNNMTHFHSHNDAAAWLLNFGLVGIILLMWFFISHFYVKSYVNYKMMTFLWYVGSASGACLFFTSRFMCFFIFIWVLLPKLFRQIQATDHV